MTKIETTDAAYELMKLAELLIAQSRTEGRAAFQVIGELLGKSNVSQPVMRAYTIVGERCDGLQRFVEIDSEFDEELKAISLDAISSVKSVFRPASFAVALSSVVSSSIRQEHITALKFLSRTVRLHSPLKLLSSDELREASNALGEALDEVLESDELPGWAKSVLIKSIEELRFIVNNIVFFGHDGTVDSILLLHSKTSLVSARLAKEGSGTPKLVKLAVAVVLLIDLFTAPVTISQAALTYKGWAESLNWPSMLENSPKLLEAPGAHRDRDGPSET